MKAIKPSTPLVSVDWLHKNIDASCWTSSKSSTGAVEKKSVCPECKGDTQEVKIITVQHFVLDSLVDEADDDNYHICLNENCDVVYYAGDLNPIACMLTWGALEIIGDWPRVPR